HRGARVGWDLCSFPTWDQLGSISAQTPGKTRVWQTPESRESQQLSQPCEICKTSIPGSNPGGASKITQRNLAAVGIGRVCGGRLWSQIGPTIVACAVES